MKKKDYLSQLLNNCNSILSNIFFLRFIVIFSFLLYFLPYLINGKSSHVLVHDNFDAGWPSLKLLSDSGQLFGNSLEKIPGILNGIVPRACFPSEFNYIFIILEFFDIFWSYVINRMITAIIGFVGMFLILKNHFSYVSKPNLAIIVGISLCFAFLPFYSLGFLSVAGQPLLLYSFLNIRKNKHSILDWCVIIIFPFCSSLVTVGVFFGILIFTLFLYDLLINKKLDWIFLFSIILMTLSYCLVEYRLFLITFFNDQFISHRSEFVIETRSFLNALGTAKNNFLYGQYYTSRSLHNYYILYTVFISGMIMLYKKSINIKYLLIMTLITIFSLIFGFWDWQGLEEIRNNNFILKSFNFSRFFWLHPLLWYIIFYISLISIKKYFKKSSVFIYLVVFLQLFIVFKNHEQILYKSFTFNQFFASRQMDVIKKYINKPQSSYKIVSLGMHPSITQYSGFHTLDGYASNYPLKHKHDFREIIKNELNRNKDMKDYYDNWGSRCYLFSHELERIQHTKNINKEINDLNLNIQKLKEMNCEYIISSVKINNFSENNLSFIKLFIDDISAWDIYLYKVI